jgi:predicted metal-dependent HD superfamily phosphohydrolase
MIRNAKDILLKTALLQASVETIEKWEYLAGALEAHYNQTFRAYHNLDHIDSMLSQLQSLDLNAREEWNQLEVEVAIVFHDTVYNLRAKSPENEAASADVALTVGRNCVEGVDWRKVHQIIMATTHRGLPDDATFGEKLIADLDLASLSGSWSEYSQVNARVRNEYLTMYGEGEFNLGRRTFLEGMLARPKIYYLRYFNEHEARSNLETELHKLNDLLLSTSGTV